MKGFLNGFYVTYVAFCLWWKLIKNGTHYYVFYPMLGCKETTAPWNEEWVLEGERWFPAPF